MKSVLITTPLVMAALMALATPQALAQAHVAVEPETIPLSRPTSIKLQMQQQNRTVEELAQLLSKAQRKGKWNKAVTYAEQILTQAPDHKQALKILAHAANRDGHYAAACDYYLLLLSHHPDDSSAYLGLAQNYGQLGEDDKETAALASYHQAQENL